MTPEERGKVEDCAREAGRIAALAAHLADALMGQHDTEKAGQAVEGLASMAHRLELATYDAADPSAA